MLFILIDVSTISHCLKALALAPKEATPTWRVHIMRHALVNMNLFKLIDVNIVIQCLKVLAPKETTSTRGCMS